MPKVEIERLWTHVHWLAILAEQGTYTATAVRLGVSKSAVSQRIVELEKATGLSLVLRTTRSVRLTDAGNALVRDVRSAYEQIARSFSDVRDSAGLARGLLRLTAPVAFARQQLIPVLAGFLGEYPEVKVSLMFPIKLPLSPRRVLIWLYGTVTRYQTPMSPGNCALLTPY